MQSLWVELHRAHPVFVAYPDHDLLRLGHCPYFPRHIVTTSPDDRFLMMEHHCAYRHDMSLLRLRHHCLLVVERIDISLGLRVCILFWKRCELRLSASWDIASLTRYRRQWRGFVFPVSLLLELVSFDL